MFGFNTPSAAPIFSDDFTSLSMRNAVPSGANKIRNADGFYGAAKTSIFGTVSANYYDGPGIPENWRIAVGAGAQIDIVSVGSTTINGQTCRTFTFRLYGTTVANVDTDIFFESEYTIRLANNQTWTGSLYVATAAGGTGLTNVTSTQLSLDFYTDAYVYVSGAYAGVSGLTNTLARFSGSGATGTGGAAWANPHLNIKTSGAVNFYLKFIVDVSRSVGGSRGAAFQLSIGDGGAQP